MKQDLNTIGELIEAMAKMNGIPITPEMEPQVRFHLEIAARMAMALLEFPLDEREEPGPAFVP